MAVHAGDAFQRGLDILHRLVGGRGLLAQALGLLGLDLRLDPQPLGRFTLENAPREKDLVLVFPR